MGRVYICDGGARGNVTLPEDHTDRGFPAGEHPINVEVLAELAAIALTIGKSLISASEGL